MRIKTWQADLLLLIVAAIWGSTFPLVQKATDLSNGGVPTYWFLAARFSVAALVLGALFWRRTRSIPLRTWAAGALVGLFLFAGYAFQTFGLAYTSSSKAGFITGLYSVMVPIFSIIWLKQRPVPAAWLGVLTATVGLGLLSLTSSLLPTYGDMLVFFCAVGFALHIVSVGRYSVQHDPISLTVVQIAVAAALSWAMHLWEMGTLAPGVASVEWWSGSAQVLLALGVCSLLATAIAFFLQNVLQPYTTPTHTAIVFATEPVWAALFSFALLGEALTLRGYIGGALILAGMFLAELPIGQRPGSPEKVHGD